VDGRLRVGAPRILPRAGRAHPVEAGFGVGKWEPVEQRVDLVSQPHVGMIDMRFVAHREDRLVQSDGIGEQLGRTPAQPSMPKYQGCWPMPDEIVGSRYRERLRPSNEKRAVE